jgi:restriction endonuclease Mrr
MESFPKFNEMPPSRDQVVESLKNKPENLEMLHQFLDAREKEVMDSKGALALNIEVAKIYRDAGLIEAARSAFQDAADQAYQEHEDILEQELLAELEKLD